MTENELLVRENEALRSQLKRSIGFHRELIDDINRLEEELRLAQKGFMRGRNLPCTFCGENLRHEHR